MTVWVKTEGLRPTSAFRCIALVGDRELAPRQFNLPATTDWRKILRDGRLVAPFAKRYDSARGYYVVVAPHAVERADVAGFVAWLRDEASAEALRGDDARRAGRGRAAGRRRR